MKAVFLQVKIHWEQKFLSFFILFSSLHSLDDVCSKTGAMVCLTIPQRFMCSGICPQLVALDGGSRPFQSCSAVISSGQSEHALIRPLKKTLPSIPLLFPDYTNHSQHDALLHHWQWHNSGARSTWVMLAKCL